ncbi:aminopeptidase N [Arthrobacter livingstonensis]|uniref:Aminopeptidase N n=1 Tax=Arthrobacter livingstonensis TaxID=670078 RepID=A0A2V5L583_9MICC|nr:aminopeptidase N [Arthrobacter livingstonensis]PYI66338.1 aminopeptidase N [Arthrobacter livingstonensis]
MSNSNLSRAEAATRKSLIKVHSYDVRVDISNAASLDDPGFATQSTIAFSCTTAGAETFLDFIGLGVESVVLNGVELDVRQVVRDARILLPGLALENEATVRATAAYSRSGEGLHRFEDPADGKVYTYTQYEPADARRVFANFEQPDLKAPFTFHVTAPANWEVASNQPVAGYADVEVDALGDAVAGCWDFAPTLPISTYITAILAGPYFKVSDQFNMTFGPDSAHAGTRLEIPLTSYCRASLSANFDTDPIFAVTKAGLAYFNELFDYPYPFGKYDQAFVPEYNLGAMENPGLVTFTESYIYTSRATDTQYQQRANTIMHEMAHMWFGDLVTMAWWDDLWLKESFADFMGHLAVAEATEWGDKSWTLFASRRKAWAYVQDQLPTTHPIVADIPHLEAAKQNFDGITYAKGASVLKQLVAFVGRDAFMAGSREYFRNHEYSNTSLADLLGPLGAASGRDLAGWAADWLQTAGISTLTSAVTVEDGKITDFSIAQEAVDPVTGRPALRPHRLSVGLFNFAPDSNDAGRLVRTHSAAVDVLGSVTDVAELAGLPAPALIVVNDQDLTYAKVRLDPASLDTALASLGAVDDALARSLVWSSLWNAVRDAELPAQSYVRAVCDHAAGEPDIALLQTLADNARFAVVNYSPPEARGDVRAELLAGIEHHLDSAAPGSDEQLVWARALATLGRGTDASTVRIRALLDGTGIPAGLRVDTELRWLLWQALAARGRATGAQLDAELALNTTAETRVARTTAGASLPEASAKAAAWSDSVVGTGLTNELLSATIEGFMVGGHDLLDAYVEPYFAALNDVWDQRSIEIAGRIVRGLFPARQDLSAGMDPLAHPVVSRTDAWLAGNADAATGLRRLLVEQRDHLVRSLTAQAAARGA